MSDREIGEKSLGNAFSDFFVTCTHKLSSSPREEAAGADTDDRDLEFLLSRFPAAAADRSMIVAFVLLNVLSRGGSYVAAVCVARKTGLFFLR